MNRIARPSKLLLTAVLGIGYGCGDVSCGDDPPLTGYADVAGIYEGSILGLALPVRISGTMLLDVKQADSLLSGEFTLDVTVSDSTGQPLGVIARGALGGTITERPVSNIRLEFSYPEECWPWGGEDLVGGYAESARTMVLRGGLLVVSDECEWRGLHMVTVRLLHED